MSVKANVAASVGKAIDFGLSLGALGPGNGWIRMLATKLQTALADALLESGGTLGVVQHATIQSAVRWERAALWSQRELRRLGDKLTADQRLAYTQFLCRASTERDKCIRALRLDRPVDPWADFYKADVQVEGVAPGQDVQVEVGDDGQDVELQGSGDAVPGSSTQSTLEGGGNG